MQTSREFKKISFKYFDARSIEMFMDYLKQPVPSVASARLDILFKARSVAVIYHTEPGLHGS